MIKRKTWREFRESKMLWWINRILHTFGWAIIVVIDSDVIIDVYPARVKFRGFTPEVEESGFIGISKYIKENADDLEKEAKE